VISWPRASGSTARQGKRLAGPRRYGTWQLWRGFSTSAGYRQCWSLRRYSRMILRGVGIRRDTCLAQPPRVCSEMVYCVTSSRNWQQQQQQQQQQQSYSILLRALRVLVWSIYIAGKQLICLATTTQLLPANNLPIRPIVRVKVGRHHSLRWFVITTTTTTTTTTLRFPRFAVLA
jgi:hypothetical protein